MQHVRCHHVLMVLPDGINVLAGRDVGRVVLCVVECALLGVVDCVLLGVVECVLLGVVDRVASITPFPFTSNREDKS